MSLRIANKYPHTSRNGIRIGTVVRLRHDWRGLWDDCVVLGFNDTAVMLARPYAHLIASHTHRGLLLEIEEFAVSLKNFDHHYEISESKYPPLCYTLRNVEEAQREGKV